MLIEEDDLLHYGILRRSGRYPWGSGQYENTRNKTFLDYIQRLEDQGMSQKEISDFYKISINDLRLQKSISKTQLKAADIAMAQRLKDKGMSNSAIADRMQLSGESSVRALLAPGAADKANKLEATVGMLKARVDDVKMVDVGRGTEGHFEVPGHVGISTTTLDTAVAVLANRGYEVHPVPILQQGTGKDTKVRALTVPGMTQRDVFLNRNNIQHIVDTSKDNGRTYTGPQPPIAIHPDRLTVLHKGEGGEKADGVVFVRPGVKDLSLNGAPYAQVRIQIGDDKFIKGMAMIKDDLPPGVDLVFNTNKVNTGNKLDALKDLDKDFPQYPFGSVVNQIKNPDGTVTSAMNLVYEKGQWEKWSKNLSSQMLSKQSPTLAKSQLDMTYERRLADHEALKALTNPVVRKRLLSGFAENTDSAASHLKAAALPHQATHVILPLSKIKTNEVYAPKYDNGDIVALIRHPHGGPFEIPELIVNNKNAEGRKLLGPDSQDAIGIHHTVAEKLSGADFDGDTVNVIRNNNRQVMSKPMLDGLKNFDPKSAYPGYEGMRPMRNTQAEMGKISNLITDMTLLGAPDDHIASAVKHSMVVIDAENHNLDHRRSYNDNNIKDLKEKYQSGGASTLISRRKARQDVPERKPRTAGKGGPVDPVTGEKRFEPTGRILRTGKRAGQPATTKSTKLVEATDARDLLSAHPPRMERLYADHSNRLKALANKARLDALNTPTPKQSKSAKKVYAKEAASLDAKLAIALHNAPLERQAQRVAATMMRARLDYNPNIGEDTKKKIKFQVQETARARVGAKKQEIKITPDEWDAIQAGAISANKLNQILNHADMEVVRQLATPPQKLLMTSTKIDRAAQMLASGYTRQEVADNLGVSVSTLDASTKK
jgi:DNA-binding CsgD family transcriptional regulator